MVPAPGTEQRPAAEPIALFDMDGTLADYDAAMQRDMALLAGPGEPPYQGHGDEAPPHLRARVRLIRAQPGWWEKLPVYAPGFQILTEARALRFQCHILTKGPASAPGAWAEKIRWCQQHVPEVPVTVTQDKGLTYGKVLVDDWPDHALRWLRWRPRGLVIMPAHPWNEGFAHPNVLRYVGHEQLPEVRERLATVRAGCAD